MLPENIGYTQWFLLLPFIIIIIIIVFKGAIRDFLQSPHSAANRLQHVRSSGPGAIVCKSRATHRALITCQVSCYVPFGTKGQLSYSVWQSWNRIYLSFILLAEPLNRWRRGGNRSTRRKPLATSFRKCHILQPEDSSPKRDSNPRSSIGGRLGKQTC